MRFTVTVDENLINEAKRTIGARSKKQTIEIALKELIRKRRLEKVASHAGKVDLAMTIDDLIAQRAKE